MKKILLYVALTIITLYSYANSINDSVAKVVALSFLNYKAVNPIGNIEKGGISLFYTANGTQNYFYVFNIYGNKGFVIVAADDNALPILGYSFENAFETSRLNLSVADWLEGYKVQIQYIIENNIPQTEVIKVKWQELLNCSTIIKPNNGSRSLEQIGAKPQNRTGGYVNPLIQTLWDQNPGNSISGTNYVSGKYNDKCPYDVNCLTSNKRCVTGCVATAMAQVLKYWNYPSKGIGSHSYNNSNYGTLSASFGTTTYDWVNMPNYLTSTSTTTQTSAISTLIYHCGVSVDMNYTNQESSAWVVPQENSVCAANALINYFGYTSIQGIQRKNYSDAYWLYILENELNNSRPIIYDGSGTGGGHCFVADGYDINDYIHFNWGWSGYQNGYFQVNALNPGGVGTGGGSGGYNNYQSAIIDIVPTSPQVNNVKMWSTTSPSSQSISYGSITSVSASLKNFSNYAFNGDICAAAFDDSLNFIDYVKVLNNQTLAASSSANFTFTDSNSLSLTPGNYSIYLFYRSTGGQWTFVGDTTYLVIFNYNNTATLTVTNNNTPALYAPLTVLSSMVQGKIDTVTYNVYNNGSNIYKGYYYAALYNLDGSLAQVFSNHYIDTSNSSALPVGNHYTSNRLFHDTIKVNPGTYLLAAVTVPYQASYSYILGAGAYSNPIKVIVQAAPLLPDVYEVNDSVGQSYLLAIPTYIGDSANFNTQGSNIHSSSDQDFYKITLPTGYRYNVKLTLNNANYSGNGNIYTVPTVLSYSLDSVTWYTTFDSIININNVYGAKKLFVHISPQFEGQTGTYLLEVSVKRTPYYYVTGNLLTPLLKNIRKATVVYSGSDNSSFIASNYFSHRTTGFSNNLTFKVNKNNDSLKTNGVTTLDIALTQSHILGKNMLSSPYKLIAADVNNDGKVSTLDIVYMKRLILGIDTTFTGNRLWTFVDSSYVFPDASNPFPYKDSISYTGLSANKTNQTFIGCKLGDVNWDWNSALARQGISNTVPVELSYAPIQLNNERLIRIPIKVKNFKELLGLQYTINFNTTALKFVGVNNKALSFDAGTNHAEEGKISFLWVDAKSEVKTLEDGSVLMELVFKNNYPLSTINYPLSIDGSVTTVVAYDKDYLVHDVVMRKMEGIPSLQQEDWVVAPNPTKDGVIQVQMNLRESKAVVFRLSDVQGRLLLTKQVEGIKGINHFTIREGTIASGTYYLQAIGVEGVKQIKVEN